MTFQEGNTNGTGRPEGSKNKLTLIREKFGDSFELTGGLEALVEWGKTHRGAYYKIIAGLFPKEAQVSVEHKHEDFINRCIEEERKKELEAGKPFKMIECDSEEIKEEKGENKQTPTN